jgi:UDP-glucose 4-epimerase
MKVLITGVAGFIGSHIAQELLKRDDIEIVGFDNLSSGLESNLELLKSLDTNNKFTFYKLDVRDFDAMNEAIKEHKIDRVFHLAALVSVQESIDNPMKSGSINVGGTHNILELARVNGIKRVIFSSSAAVYGDEPTLPKNEASVVQPISPYGLEKSIGEQYMKIYSDVYGIEAVVFRYFNVYGERQDPASDYSGVISIFNDKLKEGSIPTIFGDGKQYRDFVYVKDVARANIAAMDLNNVKYEVICVGTSAKTSIYDVFKAFSARYDVEGEPSYAEGRSGDILESVSDNTKIQNLLGIKEFHKFNEAIYNV